MDAAAAAVITLSQTVSALLRSQYIVKLTQDVFTLHATKSVLSAVGKPIMALVSLFRVAYDTRYVIITLLRY